MNFKKLMVIATVALMSAALLLTGCTSKPAPAASSAAVVETEAPSAAPSEEPSEAPAEAPALSGKLEISGSTSMQELVEELAEAFMAENAGVTVNVQGGGSSVGAQNATDGLSDIGNTSRGLKDAEKANGLVEHIVAKDGVAVIVHPNNTVADLSAEQVNKIFRGEIKNWKDVGGADAEIIVITREASSGTREAFVELFDLEEDDVVMISETALETNDNGSMMTNVAGKENAIGYCSVGSLIDTVKALKIDGVDANTENIVNETYNYWRPFNMATKGEPTELAAAFLDFVYGEGGAEIISKKYIPGTR